MATALAPYPLDSLVLEEDLIDTVVANAKAVGKAELDARYILELLAEQGKISVGAPRNIAGSLLGMACIVRELSR